MAEGRIAFVALAVIGIEVALLLRLAASRRWLSRGAILANGLSGAFLLLALHAALTGAGSGRIALWLGLSLVAHLGDVMARLRRR